MVKNWELFEEKVVKELQEITNELEFKRKGGSDSTASDIVVYKNEDIITNIECKFSPSQAAQFVVLNSDGSIIFSPQNKSSVTIEVEEILKYLNNDLDKFLKILDKSGKEELEISFDILANHFANMCKRRKIDYIISAKSLEEDFKIFSIDYIKDNFYISAVLRNKQSGTRAIPKREERLALEKFAEKYGFEYSENIPITQISDRYFGDSKEYYISNKDNTLKKRATTNNCNVILTLKLKEEIQGNLSKEDFVKEILNKLK